MDRYTIYPPGFMRQGIEINAVPKAMDDPCELPLAQATIGMQKWREIYERDKALMRGTLFCELDKPFRGSGR